MCREKGERGPFGNENMDPVSRGEDFFPLRFVENVERRLVCSKYPEKILFLGKWPRETVLTATFFAVQKLKSKA